MQREYDGILNKSTRTRALLSVPWGADRHTRFPTVLALRRGARRLDLITPISEGTGSLTHRPEGRRRGRAGGRQEYRHLSSLAQPSVRPPLRLTGSRPS